MRAALLSKHKGLLEIKEVPIPEPKDHEILVQIKASGYAFLLILIIKMPLQTSECSDAAILTYTPWMETGQFSPSCLSVLGMKVLASWRR